MKDPLLLVAVLVCSACLTLAIKFCHDNGFPFPPPPRTKDHHRFLSWTSTATWLLLGTVNSMCDRQTDHGESVEVIYCDIPRCHMNSAIKNGACRYCQFPGPHDGEKNLGSMQPIPVAVRTCVYISVQRTTDCLQNQGCNRQACVLCSWLTTSEALQC